MRDVERYKKVLKHLNTALATHNIDNCLAELETAQKEMSELDENECQSLKMAVANARRRSLLNESIYKHNMEATVLLGGLQSAQEIIEINRLMDGLINKAIDGIEKWGTKRLYRLPQSTKSLVDQFRGTFKTGRSDWDIIEEALKIFIELPSPICSEMLLNYENHSAESQDSDRTVMADEMED